MGRFEDAVEALYSADPDGFTDLRASLVKQARDHDRDEAKRIGTLRRPTRSAWTLNSLARQEPELVEQLLDLAAELRGAERSLDGAQLRDLSRTRRGLVDSLTAQAFSVSGVEPTPALRAEVVATLSSAMADERVAEGLRAGTLVRVEQSSGFSAGPTLALVPRPKAAAAESSEKNDAQELERAAAAERAAEAARREAESARREAERQAAARARVVEAKEAVGRAEQAAHELEEQLADVHRRLDEARLDVRVARADLKNAERGILG